METGSKIVSQSDSIEHFDLRFSNEPADVYILILEFGKSSLKACWFHKSKNLITGFARYPLKSGISKSSLKVLLETYPHLATGFAECLCAFEHPNYALAPSSVKPSEYADFLSITNELGEFDSFLEHELVNIKCKIIHQAHALEITAIKDSFSNVKFISLLGSRIDSNLNEFKSNKAKDLLTAHLDESYIHISAYKNGQLELCNSYFQVSKEDVAYYILFVADALSINPEYTNLKLSGSISIGDECWKLLHTYWNKMSIDEMLNGIEVNQKLDQRDVAQFDYLSHHLLCAS